MNSLLDWNFFVFNLLSNNYHDGITTVFWLDNKYGNDVCLGLVHSCQEQEIFQGVVQRASRNSCFYKSWCVFHSSIAHSPNTSLLRTEIYYLKTPQNSTQFDSKKETLKIQILQHTGLMTSYLNYGPVICPLLLRVFLYQHSVIKS